MLDIVPQPAGQPPLVSFRAEKAEKHVEKWCRVWNELARKAGLRHRLAARAMVRPGGRRNTHVSLAIPGCPPAFYSLGATDQATLRAATQALCEYHKLTIAFPY